MSKELESTKDLKNWSNIEEGNFLNALFKAVVHDGGQDALIVAKLSDYIKEAENQQVNKG